MIASRAPVATERPRIAIQRRAAARVAAGHPWVFANEIQADLKTFTPGQQVEVTDGRATLGFGFVNPRSLIAIRLLSRTPSDFGPAFFAERFRAADALRRRFRPGETSYRVAYGESDDLPGLVVDRFGDVYVMQSHAAGIDALADSIVAGLVAAFSPRGVLRKFDSSSRALEGLGQIVDVAHGEVPDRLEVDIEGSRFALDLRHGQKTGFFHDHAPNRAWLAGFTRDLDVLDVFSYVGAWSLAAAKGGATSVLGVDASAAAVGWAEDSARLSGVADRVRFEKADAFAWLADAERAGRRFDVVVLDPPAFVKSRKKLSEGMAGYREVNRRGFALVKPGGLLVTSSCSRHVDRDAFLGMLQAAADDAKRRGRIVRHGSQGADHPVHLRMPETEYLKCVFLHVG